MHAIACAIDGFLDHRRLRGVSEDSIRLYRRQLRTWLAWRGKSGFDGTDLAAVSLVEFRSYFVYLSREHIPHSGNRYRPAEKERRGLAASSIDIAWRVLSAFWRFLELEDCLTVPQTRFFAAGRLPRPRVAESVRPAIDERSITGLLAACDQHGSLEEQRRDRAIILILSESGMRISEVCSLCDEEVDHVERTAAIVGKGDKPRAVFWGPRTARALKSYLAVRRGADGGPLFRGVGSRSLGHFSSSALRSMLKRRADQAGVALPFGAPCHTFRHGFARRSLRKGMDSLHLQQFLGHSSARHTLRYVREERSGLKAIYAQYWEEEV